MSVSEFTDTHELYLDLMFLHVDRPTNLIQKYNNCVEFLSAGV
jgi:hypothetical protein